MTGLLSAIAGILPSRTIAGFRTEGRRGIDAGLMFLMDLAASPVIVYGIGCSPAAAVADCVARAGLRYPPCCERLFGMHAQDCRGYSPQVRP